MNMTVIALADAAHVVMVALLWLADVSGEAR